MSSFVVNCRMILKDCKKLQENNCWHINEAPQIEEFGINSSEFMSIDSANDLFRKLQKALADKIERNVYNRRKSKLFPFLEEIRMKIVAKLNEFEAYFIVDSMPLEICKNAHANCSSICKKIKVASHKLRKLKSFGNLPVVR